MVKTFTAAEMFEDLGSEVPRLAVVGFVKRSGDDGGAVDLAVPGSADQWVTIPEDLVERYEPLSRSACAPHDHDLVRLYLKRPEDKAGQALHDIVAGQVGTTNKAVALEGSVQPKPGAQYCYYDASGKYVCVPI